MNSQITTSTVSSANQTAVPALLRSILGLKQGDKLIWNIDSITKTAKVKAAPRDWGSYLSGLGKNIWKDVGVEKYIKEGRRDRNLP